VSRFAIWLGELGIRRPVLVLTVLVGLVLCSVPGLQRLRVATQLSALVPAESESAVALAMVADSLEHSESVYGLLEFDSEHSVVDGELARVADKLVSGFANSSLVHGSRWQPGEGLPARDPRALFSVMDEQALEEVVQRLNPEAMGERAQSLRRMLGGPMDPEVQEWLRSDPLLFGEIFADQIERTFSRVGGARQGFVSADGRALVVIIDPIEVENDPFHERLATELSAIADKVMATEDGKGRLRFGLTGARIQAWQISQASRAEATALSLVSLAVVLLLYIGFYRSLTSLFLILGLLPVAVLITLGWAGFFLGAINPLAMGFVAIVFGLGIDPAVHLISRYRTLRVEREPSDAARCAVREVGPAVLLATATTASALLLLAALDPVQGQVGLLAGLAVASNAFVMLTGLPALWVLLGKQLSPDPGLGVPTSRKLASWLQKNSTRVLAGAVLTLVLLALLATAPRFEASLRGFQPAGLESVRVQRSLEAHFGEQEGELFVLVRGSNEQEVLEVNDAWAERLAALKASGSIAGFDSVAALHPAEATSTSRYTRLNALVDMSASIASFRDALTEAGFAPGVFDSALSTLESPLSQVALEPGWQEWLEQRYMYRAAGEFRVLTRVFPAKTLPQTEELLRRESPSLREGVHSQITGVELVEYEAAQLLKHRLPLLLLFLSLGLLLLLSVAYRNARLVLAAFLPLTLSLLVFVLGHCVLGATITPFTMAGLLLLMGVGIDDHLFMLAHYLRGGRPGSLEDTMAGAGRAIFVTTITSLAAFGVLAFSQFEPLASFGRAAGLALALAFVASVVLLPALLAWRTSGVFGRG
jgi:uncharacterized protein